MMSETFVQLVSFDPRLITNALDWKMTGRLIWENTLKCHSITPAEVNLLLIQMVQLWELKQAHFIIMELCHSGLKALVMNNYCEGREHGRIQNKDTAWRGQLLKSRCMPWIIHLEKSHTLQMKACQNGSCFPHSCSHKLYNQSIKQASKQWINQLYRRHLVIG